jgi:tyrosyl-tRNA synthetase
MVVSKKQYDIDYLLKRGVAEVISENELRKLLQSGKKLRIKEGLDPSAPDIHVGHMAPLRKMRQFQELGHQIVIIVGDWTAQIGDPSGAAVTRKMLTADEVKANAETYLKQFFKIVDKDKTEIRFQSEWFGKFDLADVVRLTSKFTVAQFLAREDFNKRFNEGKPIAITELLYPLLQAYDSVAVKADVELGGTDQKFNFLVGRELQSMMGQPPQQIFMVPLLVGTDGVQKMSKSLGNYIGITEQPEDIYGKTMSIKDEFIMIYFETLTEVPDQELAEYRRQMADGANPMILKKRLAREIVTQLYNEKEAQEAEAHFEKTVQRKELPLEIKEHKISFITLATEEELSTVSNAYNLDISRLLVETGLVNSRSEANRMITHGGTVIDGEVIKNRIAPVKDGSVIQVGKRRFVKLINTDKTPEEK